VDSASVLAELIAKFIIGEDFVWKVIFIKKSYLEKCVL